MKNIFKVLGIIALTAVIGFSMAACDDGNDDGEDEIATIPEQYRGTWSGVISGLPQTLTISTNTIIRDYTTYTAAKVENNTSGHIIYYRTDKGNPLSASSFSINTSDQLVVGSVSGYGSGFYAGTYNNTNSNNGNGNGSASIAITVQNNSTQTIEFYIRSVNSTADIPNSSNPGTILAGASGTGTATKGSNNTTGIVLYYRATGQTEWKDKWSTSSSMNYGTSYTFTIVNGDL